VPTRNSGYPFAGRGGGRPTNAERAWRQLISTAALNAPNAAQKIQDSNGKQYIVDPNPELPTGIWLDFNKSLNERCQLCGRTDTMWIVFYKPSKHIFPTCLWDIKQSLVESDILVQTDGSIETFTDWEPDLM